MAFRSHRFSDAWRGTTGSKFCIWFMFVIKARAMTLSSWPAWSPVVFVPVLSTLATDAFLQWCTTLTSSPLHRAGADCLYIAFQVLHWQKQHGCCWHIVLRYYSVCCQHPSCRNCPWWRDCWHQAFRGQKEWSLDQSRPDAKARLHSKDDDDLTRLESSCECDLWARDQLHPEEEVLPAFPCKPTWIVIGIHDHICG